VLTLTLACGRYDRMRGLLDGTIGIDGVNVIPVAIESEDLFPRVVGRADFDISEMSLSSYLVQVSRGEGAYTAIPVFPVRGFRHAGIYVRSDRGIAVPKDLEARLAGIPEYQMTFGLWVRGILTDQYGVDTNAIRYRTAGTNQAGRVERLPLELPGSLDVKPLGCTATLDAALLAGEIDAIFSPTPPRSFSAGNPLIRRLFPDPVIEERAFFTQTGFFPILHVIGIRTELIAAHPDLPVAVCAAFERAKTAGLADLEQMMRSSVAAISVPWIEDTYQRALALMGADFWPYGVAANRAQLEAICRYSTEQHLARRPLTIDDLFPASTIYPR
jgi:4,5-dihydroxyphthalate decarboxylase